MTTFSSMPEEYAERYDRLPFPSRWGIPPADVEQRGVWITANVHRECDGREHTRRAVALFARRDDAA